MGLIYQKAKHCLIWLGQGPKEAEEYLEAVNELVQIEADFISTGAIIDPIFLSPEEKAQYKIPYGQTPHFKGLQLILSNMWLTRVWIVQEASLAQQATIYLGDGSVAWDNFAAAQSFARTIGLLNGESEAPINGMGAILYNRDFQDSRLPAKGEDNILALLARFRNFDASNAKDKVYGLISLLSEKHHSQWPIGLGAEQAYLDAAIRILNNDKTLDVLGIPRLLDPSVHLGRENAEIIEVPSWVPDWRLNQVPISLRMLEFAPQRDRKFATTKDSTYNIDISQDGELLGVDGYRISVIQNLGDLHWYRPIPIGISDSEFMQKRVDNIIELVGVYFNWKRTMQLHPGQESYPHSITPMSTREAFWKTIMAYKPTSHTATITKLAQSFEAFDVMATSLRKL